MKLVRPQSTVDSTHDYARVSDSRQWSNYNITCPMSISAAIVMYEAGNLHVNITIN